MAGAISEKRTSEPIIVPNAVTSSTFGIWRRRFFWSLLFLILLVLVIALPMEDHYFTGSLQPSSYFAGGPATPSAPPERGEPPGSTTTARPKSSALAEELHDSGAGATATTTAAATSTTATTTTTTTTETTTTTTTTTTAPHEPDGAVVSQPSKHLDTIVDKRHHSSIPAPQVCTYCCNDGEKYVPCLDVEACAASALGAGKYAFVLTQIGPPKWPWLTFVGGMRAQAEALAAETGGTVDVVLMMLREDAQRLSCRCRDLIQRHRIRLVEVAWSLPPTLRWWPSYWWPGKPDGWCGPQDLVRLHAVGFEEYDAVAFYDQDVEFQGDVGPVLRCAATGRFLSTSGGVGEPLNVGFFALRPDRRLLEAALHFAGNASYNERTGWAKSGFAPSGGNFVGAECGQGFFHTLFYKRKSVPARRALAAAGLPGPEAPMAVDAAQIDRCIWNYQTGHQCPRNFDCALVRAHHKPTGKPNGNDCGKLSPSAKLEPRQARSSPATACETECVRVGAHCKCDGANYVKKLTVEGVVHHCEKTASNPSGDRFIISFNGSTITAKRKDAASCWCDGDIDVQCCIGDHEVKSPDVILP